MIDKPNSDEGGIEHYNRWLTDNIQDYIKNVDEQICFLFEPYVFFIEMNSLFGLSKTYLKDQRKSKYAKKIIAVDILERMRLSLKINIEKWTKTYLYLSDLLLKAQSDILAFIDEYENKLNPKPSSYYKMYDNHPNFVRDFFKVIDTKEKAYWFGFLFADGYIVIQHTISGDYYRMGLELSEKDRILIEKFCKTIGLNLKHIKKRVRLHSYTKKKYHICSIRWGDQDFANDLINHGMEYEFDDEKGKRVKIMKLPDFLNYELMVAFILGFYDGDGSLGLKKGKRRDSIYPKIISSNKDFLLEIKEYYDIKSDIKSKIEEKYDFIRDRIFTSKMYSLYLGIDLFREMLQNYKYSLERKRIPLERIEQYGISPVKSWLMKVLPKENLQQIFKFLSPYKIGEMLGVRVETIYSLAKDVYGFEIPYSREQYIRIKQLINIYGESSQYFKDFNYWLKYLEKLGKFKE
jgi:DNA-binding transcriptional regulator WhiA